MQMNTEDNFLLFLFCIRVSFKMNEQQLILWTDQTCRHLENTLTHHTHSHKKKKREKIKCDRERINYKMLQ